METIKDTANGEVRSKKVWTGIGLAILVLVVGGLAFAAYKNPQLFRANLIQGIGGVGSGSGVTGNMGGFATPQTGSIELRTDLTTTKIILDQPEIGLPLTTDAIQNLEGSGLPLLPKVTPVLPPEFGVIPGSELRKEVLKNVIVPQTPKLTGSVEQAPALTLSGPSTVTVGQKVRYSVVLPPLDSVMWQNCTLNFRFNTNDTLATFTREVVTPPAYDYTAATVGTTTLSVSCDRYGLTNTQDKNTLTSNTLTVAVAPAPATCGNGIKEAPEACDDGKQCSDKTPCTSDTACASATGGDTLCKTREGDGCTSSCVVEPGWTCSGSPKSTCVCSAASACFTYADLAKIGDYLLGQYTPSAAEMVKFNTNCLGGITYGDLGYVSDHVSIVCP